MTFEEWWESKWQELTYVYHVNTIKDSHKKTWDAALKSKSDAPDSPEMIERANKRYDELAEQGKVPSRYAPDKEG